MGSADEVNIQASELNRTMKVSLEQACKGGIVCVRSFKDLPFAHIVGELLGWTVCTFSSCCSTASVLYLAICPFLMWFRLRLWAHDAAGDPQILSEIHRAGAGED
jgi:hypothetical protein